MKRLIEIDDDLQKALNEYFEGKRSYVGLDNGIKLLEAVKNGKEIKDDISLPEEPNKSENPNSSTTKNDVPDSIVGKIEPKTGHWIVEKGGSYLGKRNACCSNCKDFYTADWAYMNYCPNCSADMREVKE